MYAQHLKTTIETARELASRCEADFQEAKDVLKSYGIYKEVSSNIFFAYGAGEHAMNEAVRAMTDLIEESWKLVDKIRGSNLPIPYDRLLKALVTLDAYSTNGKTNKTEEESPFGVFYRVFRSDLVLEEEYLLHAPLLANEPIKFVYMGPTAEDNASMAEPPSFWMAVEGKNQKWFYADAGLEQYEKSSSKAWWHQSNWVSLMEVNKKNLEAMVAKVNEEIDEENQDEVWDLEPTDQS